MHFILYVSSALRPFGDEQLIELLWHARANNSRHGITGMLLYKDGHFMQVLEGEASAVSDLYAKITRDTRHHKQIVVDEGKLIKRQFPDWTMGFRHLEDDKLTDFPGYSEFMNAPLNAETFQENPAACHRLLTLFRDS